MGALPYRGGPALRRPRLARGPRGEPPLPLPRAHLAHVHLVPVGRRRPLPPPPPPPRPPVRRRRARRPLCVSDADPLRRGGALVRARRRCGRPAPRRPRVPPPPLRSPRHTPMYDALPWRLGEARGVAAGCARCHRGGGRPPARRRTSAAARRSPPSRRPRLDSSSAASKSWKRWAPPGGAALRRSDVELAVPLPAAPSVPAFDGIDDRSCVSEGMIDASDRQDDDDFVRATRGCARRPSRAAESGAMARPRVGAARRPRRQRVPLLVRTDVWPRPLPTLLNDDKGHTLGTFLLRMMPPADTQKEGVLMSTLRLLAHNPQLARRMPKFEDDRRVKTATMFRGQEVVTKLLERVTEVCSEQAREGTLVWSRTDWDLYAESGRPVLPRQLVAYTRGARGAAAAAAAGAGATGEIDQARRPPNRPPAKPARAHPPATDSLQQNEAPMPERRRAADSFTSSHNPPSEWSQRAPSIGEEEASPGQGRGGGGSRSAAAARASCGASRSAATPTRRCRRSRRPSSRCLSSRSTCRSSSRSARGRSGSCRPSSRRPLPLRPRAPPVGAVAVGARDAHAARD